MEIPKNESLGSQLNRMNGTPMEKNLYAQPKQLDKEQFLKMFMEQLKYQDPMNPVNNEQFSQQMAMFSQLEQQISMNKNIEKLVSNQNNSQVAALQLVGKSIAADRATIYHDKEKPSALQFKAPQDMNEIKVEIKDLNGETVRTMNMGSRNQGEIQTKWDGNDETGRPMPAGRYTYAISGKGMDGKDVKIETKLEGRVTGVTSSSGVVFLLVGDQRIGLNDVETIKESSETKDKALATNDGKTSGTENASQKANGAEAPKSDAVAAAPKVAVADDVAKELARNETTTAGNEEGSSLHPLLPMMYR